VDIEAILRAINKNGVQGPCDLREERAYAWARADIDLDYDTCRETLLRHSINHADRGENRNAYVVREASGRLVRFKTSEAELRGFVCFIVSQEPNLTSSEIVERVKLIYTDMTPVDLMLQGNLESPQDIVDQTIRNILVSNYKNRPNSELLNRSPARPYTYTLTDRGFALAERTRDSIREVGEATQQESERGQRQPVVPYSEAELQEISARNRTFRAVPRWGATRLLYPVDARLRETVMRLSEYRCWLYRTPIAGLTLHHETFLTPDDTAYVEGHHLVPMAAQNEFPSINLDCMENLCALCPTCHRAIHLGHGAVKGSLARHLFQRQANALRSIGLTNRALAMIAKTEYECDIGDLL